MTSLQIHMLTWPTILTAAVGLLFGTVSSATGCLFLLALFVAYGSGFRTVPIGHGALLVLLGVRVPSAHLGEGLLWIPPYPIGDLLIVDLREQTLPLRELVFYTKDDIPVRLDVNLQYRILDIFCYSNAERAVDAFQAAVQDTLRRTASSVRALELPGNSGTAHNLGLVRNSVNSGTLQDTCRRWGLSLVQAHLTNLRLPAAIEAATTAAKRSEYLAEIVRKLASELGISTERALDMIQVDFGQTTRNIIDGDLLRNLLGGGAR